MGKHQWNGDFWQTDLEAINEIAWCRKEIKGLGKVMREMTGEIGTNEKEKKKIRKERTSLLSSRRREKWTGGNRASINDR